MVRIFCESINIDSSGSMRIEDKDELHHLRVRRVSLGDIVSVLDGSGRQYIGEVVDISERVVVLKISKILITEKKKPKFILACSLIPSNRFDLVIEQASEFGIDAIVPLLCKRTVARLPVGTIKDRWRRKAIEVCKQCANPFLPIISPVIDVMDFVEEFADKNVLMLIPHLEAKGSMHIIDRLKGIELKTFEYVVIMIGPEGDFTPEEIDFVLSNGGIGVSLGDFVLRVETAAGFCSGIASYFCEIEWKERVL